jgi:hypothetical protein
MAHNLISVEDGNGDGGDDHARAVLQKQLEQLLAEADRQAATVHRVYQEKTAGLEARTTELEELSKRYQKSLQSTKVCATREPSSVAVAYADAGAAADADASAARKLLPPSTGLVGAATAPVLCGSSTRVRR